MWFPWRKQSHFYLCCMLRVWETNHCCQCRFEVSDIVSLSHSPFCPAKTPFAYFNTFFPACTTSLWTFPPSPIYHLNAFTHFHTCFHSPYLLCNYVMCCVSICILPCLRLLFWGRGCIYTVSYVKMQCNAVYCEWWCTHNGPNVWVWNQWLLLAM